MSDLADLPDDPMFHVCELIRLRARANSPLAVEEMLELADALEDYASSLNNALRHYALRPAPEPSPPGQGTLTLIHGGKP